MARPSLARVALFARRRYRAIFLLAGLLVGGSLLLASRLRFETDVLSLLPRRQPAVATFRRALEEFGSVDHLFVVVRLPAGAVLDPYGALVDRLAERLRSTGLFDEVTHRTGDVEELMESFLPVSLLFLEPAELERVADKLSDEALELRAREIRRLLATPQALGLKGLVLLDPFGLTEIFLDRVSSARAGLAVDWSSGYLLSQDRAMLLLLAQPRRPPQDVGFSAEMAAELERQIDELLAEWPQIAGPGGAPPPAVELAGRHVIGLGDAELIRSDVVANVLTSMIGVLTLFLFAFRRFGPLLYAFLPLVAGLALTFGFSAATYGVLSAATSGIAALLVGLGIDFVIVSYGRFVEERQRGADLEQGLARMSGWSGRAVLIGGVTSAATFYSFGVTDFPGLYQMGYLTGTGILFCMAAVLLLLPAMLAWSEDHHRRRRRFPRLFLHGFGSARWIRISLARPRLMLALGVALTVAAAWSARDLRFDDSVRSMRPKGNPAVELRDEVAERFGSGFDQMILMVEGDSLEETLALADRAAAGAAELVGGEELAGLDAVSSIVPPLERQRRALDWLAGARGDRLDMERVRASFGRSLTAQGLRGEPFAPGIELLGRAVERRKPLDPRELAESPETARLLDRYLHPADGGWRSAVYLYPPARRWTREPPPGVVRLAERLGPRAEVTGANVVSGILRRQVVADAIVASVLGLLLVAALLWLDFRRLRDTVLSLVPLLTGILWMLGAMAALDVAMNFMNIFVTTMIIGIGVDYGLHMIHRFRELEDAGRERLFAGLAETGKAIVLAALSTLVGFGTLARSHYPGLASMGMVAILGALSTCLVAITLLPAWIALRRKGRAGG